MRYITLSTMMQNDANTIIRSTDFDKDNNQPVGNWKIALRVIT